MFGRTKAPSLSSIHSRISAIADREDQTASLIERFESDSRAARDAIAAAGRAREERDEYRRVLAGAIASDQRNKQRIDELDADRKDAELTVREEVRKAGATAAERDAFAERIASLEALVRTQAERHERALADTRDRAWAEREAARAEIFKLGLDARQEGEYVIAEVREALQEITDEREAAQAIAEAAGSKEIGSMRQRLLVGLGLAAAVLGIAVTPHAVLSAFDAEQAVFVHLASGLSPWHLIVFALSAFGLAVVLLTFAKRDAERHPQPA